MTPILDPFGRVLADFDNITHAIVRDGRDAQEQETVELLTDSITRFGGRLVDAEEIDALGRIPQALLSAAGELGLFGLTTDPAFGGAGLSMKATSRCIRTLGELNCSLGVSLGLHNGLGLRGLQALGSPELQARYLPDLAAGRSIACFAATESEAGSDIAALRTTAHVDGDQLVINGAKIYVTNGGFANIATLIVRSPGLGGSARGHSLVLVPLDLPGVKRDAEERKLGIKGSSTCTLTFEGVRVPLSHILGTPSKGLDHLGHILTYGRTFLAAGCVGLAEAALKKALAHVTERKQFNRPLAEFGMVREKLAFLRSRLFAMESLSRLVTGLEDERPDSIGWESSVAKIICSESGWQAADEAVQMHGGMGFLEDTGVARMLRDIRITRIFEGANEVLRFHLAAAAFGWNTQRLADSPALATRLHPRLTTEGIQFDTSLRRLAEVLAEQRKQHGLKVFQRQLAQRRIADVLGNLYTSLALLARAQGELTRGRASDELVGWTQHALWDCQQRIEHGFHELHHNVDTLSSQIAVGECARTGSPVCETLI